MSKLALVSLAQASVLFHSRAQEQVVVDEEN